MYKTTTLKYILIAVIASVGIGFSTFYLIAHKNELISNNNTKITVLTSHELDSDGDTISDFDERERGTDPYNIDTDGDGYSDNQEIAGGFDPLAREGAQKRDSDGDGLNDEEEKRFGTSPFLADTDFDGKEDGTEVIAGSDPTNADLSYFLEVASSKAESDSIVKTYNDGTAQIEDAVAQSGNADLVDSIGTFGGSEDALSQIADSGIAAIDPLSLGAGDISNTQVTPELISSLESTLSTGDVNSLQSSFSSFVKGSSLNLDPLATVEAVELPEIKDEELKIIDTFSKEDLERYFTIVSLILSKDVPFTDANSFEQFAVNLRLENKNDMSRVKKVLHSVEAELRNVEVPRDDRILNLHKKSISFIMAASNQVQEIESINFSGTNTLSEVTGVLPRVNYLSNVVFNGEILPEIRKIIEDYQLSSLIKTLEIAQ